jgi:signal peptidase
MPSKVIKAVGAAFGTVVSVAVICVLLVSISPLLAARNPVRPTFFGGYTPMIVLGGSMEPTYRIGSILLVEAVAPESVRVGDVITYESPRTKPTDPPTLTTHRVIACESREGQPVFRTQGDANNAPDTWLVPAGTVVGRGVFAVPYLGYLSSFVRSRVGFLSLVVLPAVLLVIMEVTSFAKGMRLRRRTSRRGRGRVAAEAESRSGQ